MSSLNYFRDLPKLPGDFQIPSTRNADMFDFLHCVFGFQVHASFYIGPHVVFRYCIEGFNVLVIAIVVGSL